MGERSYLSTTAGLLAEVLYRQDRRDEAAEFAANCRELASSDDVASQFHWRCVDAKLLAREGAQDRAVVLVREALGLIGDTDFLNLQGNGFMDLAEVCQLCGQTGQALDALARASELFVIKGNIVSARSAAVLAADLQAIAGREAS
jgi:tetratricopeptide (TPR) repeat protein